MSSSFPFVTQYAFKSIVSVFHKVKPCNSTFITCASVLDSIIGFTGDCKITVQRKEIFPFSSK